jgi:PAS domain S-box-containing protein
MPKRPSEETRTAPVVVLATTTFVLAACIVALVASPERASSLHLQSWSRATLAIAASALAMLAVGMAVSATVRSRRPAAPSIGAPPDELGGLEQRAREAVRRSQRLASQLHQLIAASISIAGLHSEGSVVEGLARRARGAFDAETAVVTLFEGPGAPLVATATRGQDTVVGTADSSGAPRVSLADLGSGSPQRVAGWLVAPILVTRGAARGTVSVRRRDEIGFSDDDVEIATLLAQMAASALSATELNQSILSSEERLRVLVETAPIGIVESKADGQIRWWNRAAGSLFGWSDDERAGGGVASFPPGLADVLAELWRTAAAGAPVAGHEVPGVEISGGRRELAVSVARLPSMPGEGDIFLSLVDDVTDHRQLMEELRHAQRMEVIGQLSSSVAHDFNNLLTLIAGYTELLNVEVAVSDRARQLIGDIQATTSRASTLTGKLLTMGRTKSPAPVVFAPAQAVRSIAEVLDRIIGTDIELDLDLDPTSPNVRADPDQFEQMVMNLATNARDAMEAGGRLRIVIAPAHLEGVSASRAGLQSGEFVHVAVTDTGAGMDEATRQQCFEPLFTTKGPARGTGLGLPAARRVVTESGGSITCQSVPGEGTTFDIYLPAVWDAAPATAEPERATEAVETATVLLAEDEEGIRSLMSRVLVHRGFEVLEAESGERALAIARAHGRAIELLVSDVVMPGMSGRELALELQTQWPDLLIILASGNLDASVLDGLADGSAVFLPKPFKPSELVNVIAELRSRRGAPSPAPANSDPRSV